jgi:hypothetical protein
MMKSFKITKTHIFLAIFVVLALLSLIDDPNDSTSLPEKQQQVAPSLTKKPSSDSKKKSPEIKNLQKEMVAMAVNTMKQSDAVRDAAVSQVGNIISLALIVQNYVTPERSKELGDAFVRQVISLCDEGSLGKEIGKSKFNYLIGVYRPDKTEIVSVQKLRPLR